MLHQPHAEVSIDERMVKSKARFSFHQYIKNKPTKWGFKLWCLCDSHNGFTNNFTIYRGKEGESLSGNGLGHDVVMNLSSPFLNQGYRIYMDNFYTSPQLLKDLYENKTYATGTMASNRRGFPSQVKNKIGQFKNKPRGSGLYMRDDKSVYVVWKDTKLVTVGTTEHGGHSEGKVMEGQRWPATKKRCTHTTCYFSV